MLEEYLISGTEVIEAWFPVGCMEEAQTRTFPMTGLEPQAFTALAGQGLLLEAAEVVLLRSIKHLRKSMCAYVTQFILRKDKVVAAIHIAIMLHDGSMTALLGIDADTWLHAHPTCKGGIEKLDKNLAHIVSHPFVEDDAHEVSPFLGANAEGSNGTVLVEELCKMPPVAMLLDALHDRTYLQVLALQLVAVEAVEAQRVFGIMVVGSRHRVPLDIIFIEHPDTIDNSLPSAVALSIESVGIVLFLSAVDADTDEPAFVVKELAPFGCQQGAVCLNAVADALASPIVLLQLDDLLVEAERLEHWFAAMPCKEHVWCLLKLDVVADVLFQ